jgi:hypothetical protein
MERRPDLYLGCPNCGEAVFFIRLPGKSPAFLRVDSAGNVLLKKPLPEGETIAGRALHCTACGWNGEAAELARPA